MAPGPTGDASARQAQYYAVLLRLLALDPTTEVLALLARAASLVGGALDADLVDVFLYEGSPESLVALGEPDSSLRRQRRAVRLDRLLLAQGGLTVQVFQGGGSYRTGRLDCEPGERHDIVQAVGLLSTILCRIQTDAIARGVLQAASTRPDYFMQTDLDFLEGAARWMGLVMHRTDLAEHLASDRVQAHRIQTADELLQLTNREREVALLIAQGLTNAQIAVRLVLVKGTVGNHVGHILRRLGFTRRTQIAVWAVEHGLY